MRLVRILGVVCSMVLLTTLMTCGKQKAAEGGTADVFNSPKNAPVTGFHGFFAPVYERAEAEPPQYSKKKREAFASVKAAAKDASVIPGIRTLTAYKTAYNTERKESAAPVSGTVQQTDKADPLTVADWGPRNSVPSSISNPSLYVVFSQPVKTISMLEPPSSQSEYMHISPPAAGVFRWYGSRYLAFEADGQLDPFETYTITVPETVRDLNGNSITGKTVFTLRSEPLAITGFEPVSPVAHTANTWVALDTNNLIPEAANELCLLFNYPVQAAVFAPFISVVIQPAGQAAFSRSCTVKQKDKNSLLVHIDGDIPFDSDVTVSVTHPKSTAPLTISYHTLLPFKLEGCDVRQTRGRYGHPVYLSFSHDIDPAGIVDKIKTEPAMDITEENIHVYGQTAIVYNLPVEADDTYTLHILPGIKDRYGRSIAAGQSYTVTVPNEPSYVDFRDSGVTILEAAYPHKFVFQYQNLLNPSSYSIKKTDTPLEAPWKGKVDTAVQKKLHTADKNKKQFEVIDLDPFLTDGRGFVRFDAEVTLPSSWDDNTYTEYNCTTIQVTDLAITARCAANKTLALVTSLSTGKPVAGAAVYLYDSRLDVSSAPEKAFASGITDEQGLAVLTYDETSIAFFDECREAVLAEKDGDRVVFYPESHSPWQTGVDYTLDPEAAVQKRQCTFMFSDRGLYKPGETCFFRGIDKTQQASVFTPYTGGYTMTLKEYTWEKPNIIGELKGSCSESGGFWGSFDLPKDITPGYYVLNYLRDDGSAAEELFINVAFFERLAFEAHIGFSGMSSTQQLNAEVSASYLSGEAVSDASYRGSWYRQGFRFSTDNPVFRNYAFGPADVDTSLEQLTAFKGQLSGDGKAGLVCTAAETGVVGLPYRYIAEAAVTDKSNQSITARAATEVHPAAFYAGIGPAENLSGFVKTGQTVSFPYMLASPDGNPLDSLALTGDSLSVTLIREDWKIVQQQGSGGSVYSSYEKENIVESADTIKTALKGTVKVTPKKAGYHVLTISGNDKNGKQVKTDYTFYVTGSNAVFWNRDFETALRLTPDQSQYNPGDTARILLETPLPSGTYLITVEREGIFTEELRTIAGNTSVLEIPVALNYVPVVYVSVASYSVRSGPPRNEYGQTDMDKPKGFYGAAAIRVNPRVKAFSVAIETDKDSYKPGEKACITLTASRGGKPLQGAELTLLAIDRGVLDLINYHVPDPLAFFYSEENYPLCVKGGDTRSLLMDPVVYEIKNLMGGDSEDGKDEERSNFNPVAVFKPVLITDAAGKVRAEFTLPDTLTSYRITAVGIHGDLCALHEEELTVKNKVNAFGIVPSRLRERDTSECGVLLSNTDTKQHRITVTASVRAGTGTEGKNVLIPAGSAFIDGTATRTVTIGSGQQAAVYFDLAAVKAGSADIVFDIASDILNEKVVKQVVIEKPLLFETFTTIGSIAENQTEVSEYVTIPSAAEANEGALRISFDSSRLGMLSSAVNYVFNYPYNCLEQQSSRILPLVIFEKYIDVFGLESKIHNPRAVVIDTLASWKEYQNPDGGFPYWPGGTDSDFYVSVRIAHICAKAYKQGYTLTDLSIGADRLLGFITGELQKSGKKMSKYMQAYTCYVLALHGKTVPQSILESLESGKQNNPAVLALTGLTYTQRNKNGDLQKAQQCADTIRRYLRPEAQGVDLTVENRGERFWYANDKTLDFALLVQLFVMLNPQDEMVTKLLHTLLSRQKAGYWCSTVITAHVLDAVETVMRYRKLDTSDLQASAVFNGKEVLAGRFTGAGAKPAQTALAFGTEPLKTAPRDTPLPLQFKKKGSGSLFYTTSLSYALPQEMQVPRDEGLGLTHTIIDTETGKELTPISPLSNVIELKSGRIYQMTLRLSSGRDHTFVALRAPVPSGAEIMNEAFVTTGSMEDAEEDDEAFFFYPNSVSSRQIYSNEIRYFWNEYSKGGTSLQFTFRAIRRGIFPCPPPIAECMYENEVFGRSSGYLFVIR